MTREKWEQVKDVLDQALAVAPSERSAFLERACASDKSLRDEVESLLSASDGVRTSFLQSSPPAAAIRPGARLGDYEVEKLIGAGGMGEVYRAHDVQLKRDVAIKVVPSFVANDPDRLRRFEQEARAAAALNHPNVLAVHQLGSYEGTPYLVSELLDGTTLREQMKRGPMPLRKAIDYGLQIAGGLAAAHQKGITHRDLKPENLFVTKDGQIKILDFGLAKLTQPLPGSEHDAPTIGSATEPGIVMGTVGYMSPEQVRGQAVDQRTDIFAFGAILYEMLSGKRAFQRSTSAETMTAILNEDPAELTVAAQNVSPGIARFVRHCLEKDPGERFQSASDVEFALAGFSGSESPAIVKVRGWRAWTRRFQTVGLVLLLGIVTIVSLRLVQQSEAPQLPMLAAILPPPGDGFWADLTQPAAISPDGRFLALIAMRDGHTQLWLRPLNASEAQPIAGTEDARNPFWSPDSHYIAFFVPGKLKKVEVSGGTVSNICQAGRFPMGGAWSRKGVIVFATFANALKQVADSGGIPQPISGAGMSKAAIGQLWPAFLPDGNHFLYLEWSYPIFGSNDDGVWLGSLDGAKPRRLALTSTNVQYSSGYLLFMHESDLVAQEFDTSRFELRGTAFPLARNIEYDTFLHGGMFTVSSNGELVYGTEGTGVNTQLTWLDRDGKTLGSLGAPGHFLRQSISPDGKRVAVGVKSVSEREKIWIYDVERETRVPLDNNESGGELYSPTWSADGKQIAYRTTAGKVSTLLLHDSDGSGTEKQGFNADLITVTSWSADSRYIATDVTRYQGKENWQSSVQVEDAKGLQRPVLEIENAESGKFSPDGHWLAYLDEDSGQIYVTSFPVPRARIAISSKGGADPRWRGDGQELFYVADDQTLFSVEVRESQPEFHVLSSHPLFRFELPNNAGFYDVTRDGKHFLANIRTEKEQRAPLTVVTNWRTLSGIR